MILYGLSGTNGSGKDSMGHFLAAKHNFLFVSVTDMLRDEATKRKLPSGREVLRSISTEWRRAGGLGVLVDKAAEVYQQKGGDSVYAGLVMASMRNPGEADRIHELGGKMIWLDADARIRYDRITSANRGRHDEDNKSFGHFLAEQEAEMQHSGDAATLSMADVRERCDIFIDNDSTGIEEFQALITLRLGL